MVTKAEKAANRITKSLQHNLLVQSKMGESKHDAKLEARANYLAVHGDLIGWNPAEAEGIYSVKTMDTYTGAMPQFARYCAAHGANRIGDITESMAEEYLRGRDAEGASGWAVSTFASAINKALGYTLSPKALSIGGRRKADIRRSRMSRAHDSRDFSRYADQISFAKATGVRRESVTVVRPCDCVRNADGVVIGVHVIEKGKRHRVAPVLNDARETVTRIADAAIAHNGANAPIFKAYDTHIDNHRFRAEYAAAMLHQLETEYAAGAPLFDGAFDSADYIKIRGKDALRDEMTQSHRTQLLAALSGCLGHNRVDVVLRHYLYLY